MVIRLSNPNLVRGFSLGFSGLLRKAVNVGFEIWSFPILLTAETLTVY